MVEYVVENSWEKVANINFDFKSAACATTNQGIIIRITDTETMMCGSRSSRYAGRPYTCARMENGTAAYARMLLNFTFDNFKGWMSPVAVDTALRKKQVTRMIFYSAIHEFGHALGFKHEDDRVYKKLEAGATMCSDDDGEMEQNGMPVSYYDIHSVMHYLCNQAGNWKNGPPVTLSCGDMSTVRWMYGDRNTHIGPKCLKAHATNLELPTTPSDGYSIPAGGYDLGSGADVYENVVNPVYTQRSDNGWYLSSHTQPDRRSAYTPVEEPKITMAINPETKVEPGLTQEGYRLTFTFLNSGTYFAKPKEAWVQELTLSTIAGPVTIYRDDANPKDNKPLWAYSPPGGDLEGTYPIRIMNGDGRIPDLDQTFTMSSGRISLASPTWSIWVPKGQPAYRGAQDEYKVLFQPPLPGINVQSANQAGLYLADMNFYAVRARFAYWDGAWYESINIKGALPSHPDSVRYFFNGREMLSKTKRTWNPVSPTRFLQVGVTEVTMADYFFATSRRVPYAPTTLDFTRAGLSVTGITWFDAVIYCNLRSELEGLEKVYSYTSTSYASGPDEFKGRCVWISGLSADHRKNGYRLPTEHEWMRIYSRPGTEEYYWSSQEDPQQFAWFGSGMTSPKEVGRKMPNERGFYDLSGNAAEYVWTGVGSEDTYLKGGSVADGVAGLGRTSRYYAVKYDPGATYSFRVVRTLRRSTNNALALILFNP